MSNSVISRSKCWFGDETVNYNFPDNWDINVVSPGKAIALTDYEVSQQIQHSIGCQSIKTLLDSKKKVLYWIDSKTIPPEHVFFFNDMCI